MTDTKSKEFRDFSTQFEDEVCHTDFYEDLNFIAAPSERKAQ